jgi:hypothetical protein
MSKHGRPNLVQMIGNKKDVDQAEAKLGHEQRKVDQDNTPSAVADACLRSQAGVTR